MNNTSSQISLENFNHVSFTPRLLNRFLKDEGALRDIYIDDCSIEDWDKVVKALKESDFILRFSMNEIETGLPLNISSIFSDTENYFRLEVREESVIINSYFCAESQIEFDIDPRDFVGIDQFQILYKFMRLLARETGKVVKLTQQNCNDIPFLLVAPGDDGWVYVSRYNRHF